MTAHVELNGRKLAIAAIVLLMAATSFVLGRASGGAGADVGPGFDVSSPEAAAASFEANLAAATGYFMKLGSIPGESVDRDHEGWIDLLSVSQGLHQPGGGATGATRRRGAVVMEDIVCTKELDKSSPKIAESVANGTVHPTATIELTRQLGDLPQPYLRIELKNVLVTSYQMSGSGGEIPVESCSLNFSEIRVVYTEYDAQGGKKGNIEYTWKIEEGTA